MKIVKGQTDNFLVVVMSLLVSFWCAGALGLASPKVTSLTFNNLVVGEVQVEQEEHVEGSQRATKDETRRLAHRARDQHCHLQAGRGHYRHITI